MWQSLISQLSQYHMTIGRPLQQTEISYLHNAFIDIDVLFNNNLANLERIKYIMLSEAPLWGKQEPHKYIYNLSNKKDSSFFKVKNLKDAILQAGQTPLQNLKTKMDLVTELNMRDFLIMDVSPYALNRYDTSINYGWLSRKKVNNYQSLLLPTLNIFFDAKMRTIYPKLISAKDKIKVFYRYPRIEKHLGTSIQSILSNYGISIMSPPLNNIFKQGGGIDIHKLSAIL